MRRNVQRATEAGIWEMTTGPAHSALRPYVTLYCGYAEFAAAGRRMQVPHPNVVLVIGLGPALRVIDARRPGDAGIDRVSFTAGIHDARVFTESSLPGRGLQINLTPIGAHMVFGVPMDALANRVFDLEDVFGDGFRRLVDRLHEASGWERCFDILDEALLARVQAARGPKPLVARAAHVLRATRGAANIAGLARDAGCSQRHLIASFREGIGVTPKTYARIIRFDHALRRLRAPDGERWADIADASGYYDQAHLIRDFQEFTGLAPSQFLAR